MTTHQLKCWPAPFDLVAVGLKLHEVRVNDRDYRSGDMVQLCRWDPEMQQETGQHIVARIGHVTYGGEWQLQPGLCVFSLLDVEVRP